MKAKHYYISLNREEIEVLREASYIESALYLILKELANFKTGVVGDFRNQKVTYSSLSAKLSRPSSQGKPEVKIGRDETRRHTSRLVQLGLVSNVVVGKEKLTLALPLSPLKEQAPDSSSAIGETVQATPKLQRADARPFEASPMTKDEFDPFLVPPSVLVKNKGSTPSSWFADLDLDGVGDDDQQVEPESSPPEPPITSAVDRPTPTAKASMANDRYASDQLEVSRPLTLALARSELARMKYKFVDLPVSRALYEEWEATGFTLGQLRDAASLIQHSGCGDRTAGTLDKVLRRRHLKRSNNQWGSVML